MNNMIEHYKSLVFYLGNILPRYYEVVLQDINEGKIVAIANGDVSGRCINSPLTDYALNVISDQRWKTKDCELNYTGRTQDGKLLRSSTFFLKENDELKGMLCININVSAYQKLSNEILFLCGAILPQSDSCCETSSQAVPLSTAPVENFSKSRDDVIVNTIDSCLSAMNNAPVSRLTQAEKLEIVKVLSDKGVFLLKGAISDTANKLCCSEATIYRYLSKISKQKQL